MKVPEKMPLDGFTKVGELFFVFFLKAATIQRSPWTATAEEVEQQKKPSETRKKVQLSEKKGSYRRKTGFVGSVSVIGKRSVICCSHMQVLM